MADVTVASVEDMEPIYDGIPRRARAIGVTFWDADDHLAGKAGEAPGARSGRARGAEAVGMGWAASANDQPGGASGHQS